MLSCELTETALESSILQDHLLNEKVFEKNYMILLEVLIKLLYNAD